MSSEIMYGRHPEPEQFLRFENPSNICTDIFLKYYQTCKISSIFSDLESYCEPDQSVESRRRSYGCEKDVSQRYHDVMRQQQGKQEVRC